MHVLNKMHDILRLKQRVVIKDLKNVLFKPFSSFFMYMPNMIAS